MPLPRSRARRADVPPLFQPQWAHMLKVALAPLAPRGALIKGKMVCLFVLVEHATLATCP